VVSRQIWEIGKAHSFFPLSDCDGSWIFHPFGLLLKSHKIGPKLANSWEILSLRRCRRAEDKSPVDNCEKGLSAINHNECHHKFPLLWQIHAVVQFCMWKYGIYNLN
jgi:hypothetical protein